MMQLCAISNGCTLITSAFGSTKAPVMEVLSADVSQLQRLIRARLGSLAR